MLQGDFFMNILVDDIENQNNESTSKKSKKINQKRVKNLKRVKSGGYRPVLVDESNLSREALDLNESMTFIRVNYMDKNVFVCEQDIASFYLIVYLNQRYPNQMLENYSQIIGEGREKLNIKSRKISELPICFKNQKIKIKLDEDCTLFDLVNQYNLHSVPYSARHALANWYLDTSKFSNLILFVNEIPSNESVLRLQSESKRCVSLICNRIDRLVLNERDPLSFLLHDLVHAYKMFVNDYLFKGQIGFYNAILKIFDNNLLLGKRFIEDLMSSDEMFSDEFNYLISDMNSHSKHLFYYFKAILINAVKRKYNLVNKNDFLRDESLNEFNQMFECFLSCFEMNEEEKSVARQILFEVNSISSKDFDLKETQPFNLLDFSLLDNYFFKLA
jgi:hypothetical protein